MTTKLTPPEKLTGGCLCGAIRYTVTVPPDYEWPPKYSGTCQCTQCRKFTGCLKMESCTFLVASVTPPLDSNPTYKLYASSEKGRRGFCSTCGSSLTFSTVGSPRLEILFGGLDEEVLKSEVGSVLCDCKGHLWVGNAVKGVTDVLEGEMWRGDYGVEVFEKEKGNYN